MLRLTVLLCAAIYVTLLIAGKDNGQLRPGLAAAVASGDGIVVLERRAPTPVVVAEPEVVAEVAPVAPAPLLETAGLVEEPPATPVRKVTPEPVFTLSALPTVKVDPVTAEPAVAEASAPAADPLSGEIWYVAANSVNVREGPSTDTSVLGKLTRGEAVAVTFEEGSEWARVVIEGDGVEGYVALRFLSPEAP